MTTDIQWDVERSLRECPPELLYKPEDGVIFEKRHVISLDKLTFFDDDQPKEQINLKTHVADLRDSFENNGWIYTQPPLVYMQDGRVNRGRAGWGRSAAAIDLGWNSIIVDKVRYVNELQSMIHMIKTNDHAPHLSNRARDYAKTIIKILDSDHNWIQNDDDAIMDFIKEIASTRSSKVHKSILSIVRGRVSKYDNVKTYDKDSSAEKCLELGLPFGADSGLDNCGKYGYVKPRGTFKALAHDAMTLLINTKGKPVYVTGYIDNPSDDPETLQEQRETWLDSFNSHVIEFINNFYQYNEGKELQNPIKIYPIGFLPQNVTAIGDGSGEVKESGLVNVDGSPKVRTFESILEDHPTSQV